MRRLAVVVAISSCVLLLSGCKDTNKLAKFQILEQRKQRKVYYSSAESRQNSMKSKNRPVFYSSKKSGPAPRGVKQALEWVINMIRRTVPVILLSIQIEQYSAQKSC